MKSFGATTTTRWTKSYWWRHDARQRTRTRTSRDPRSTPTTSTLMLPDRRRTLIAARPVSSSPTPSSTLSKKREMDAGGVLWCRWRADFFPCRRPASNTAPLFHQSNRASRAPSSDKLLISRAPWTTPAGTRAPWACALTDFLFVARLYRSIGVFIARRWK